MNAQCRVKHDTRWLENGACQTSGLLTCWWQNWWYSLITMVIDHNAVPTLIPQCRRDLDRGGGSHRSVHPSPHLHTTPANISSAGILPLLFSFMENIHGRRQSGITQATRDADNLKQNCSVLRARGIRWLIFLLMFLELLISQDSWILQNLV